MKFYIVDAFTAEKFGGNPAGVVILPDGADFPADEIMVKTAAELRYSETAFIKNLGGGEFNISISLLLPRLTFADTPLSAPSRRSFTEDSSRTTVNTSTTLLPEIWKLM